MVKKHSDLTKSGKTVTLNNLLELYGYMGRNIPGNFVIEDKVMFGFIFPTLRGGFLFQTNLTEVVAEGGNQHFICKANVAATCAHTVGPHLPMDRIGSANKRFTVAGDDHAENETGQRYFGIIYYPSLASLYA